MHRFSPAPSRASFPLLLLLPLLALVLGPGGRSTAEPPAFEIRLSPSIANTPVNGRLFVFTSRKNARPIQGPDWFSPEPFFAREVRDFRPGEARVIGDADDAFPEPLSKLPAGRHTVQAILDHDFYHAHHAKGAGNFFSDPEEVEIGKNAKGPIRLRLTHRVEPAALEESAWLKFVIRRSDRLSAFHGREVIDRCAVVLPAGYDDDPERRYPVLYRIGGFGSTLEGAARRFAKGPPAVAKGEAEFIHVILTGQCKWGHHVYADSATNGPRGAALIEELVPLIDRTFRTVAGPGARLLTGHSSGGWASLWLQVNYPDTFGGVWSLAPDPVDFRDWQGTNLYAEAGESVYTTADGKPKPIARKGTQPELWYRSFCKMDDVLGRGGQLRSFEAVFSPLTSAGLPALCWNRKTGRVRPDVAESWKRFDISLRLEESWADLQPRLEGKIHVYMGELDTFYLEGATALLGERLRALGSDAVVEIFPGKDHATVASKDLRERIAREMTSQFRKNHPED